MTLTSLVSLNAVLSDAGMIVSLGALAWLYQRTRLPAVGANLLWRVISGLFVFVNPYLIRNGMHLIAGVTPVSPTPVSPLYAAGSVLSSLINVLLFVWMFVALVQWARPGTRLLPLFGRNGGPGTAARAWVARGRGGRAAWTSRGARGASRPNALLSPRMDR